jgi:hypothetical protein
MDFRERAEHWVKTGKLLPAHDPFEKRVRPVPSLGLNPDNLFKSEVEHHKAICQQK